MGGVDDLPWHKIKTRFDLAREHLKISLLRLPDARTLREVFELKYGRGDELGWGPRLRLAHDYYNPDDWYEELLALLVGPGTRWLDIGEKPADTVATGGSDSGAQASEGGFWSWLGSWFSYEAWQKWWNS